LKAVYFHQHGDIHVLNYGEVPTPDPKENEVRVRLEVAALNRSDLWVRNGWPGLRLEYPHIPGGDGAGVIDEAGRGVTNLQVGTRVVLNPSVSCGQCENCIAGMDNLCSNWHLLGETIRGTYAQYVTVPARNVLPMPDTVSFQVAAASALVFQTAWHSMITRGHLKAGETVLIVGAGGGVNTASIQIAKLAGARVLVVGSNAEKLEKARELGADILIDRNEDENWSKKVYQLTEKRGVDVVVDNVGITFPQSFRAARKGGRILTVGNTGGAQFEIDNRYIFGKHLTIIGSTMSTHQDFREVMRLVFEGKLTPVIDRTFALSEAREAQAYLESGRQFGKILLTIE